MPLELNGRLYYAVDDVLADLGISRQTLWRWRRSGAVPAGHRFRDRQVVFDEDEFEAIRSYATHIEPLIGGGRQLRLFRNGVALLADETSDSSKKGRG